VLAQRREVDVVLERDRDAELLGQLVGQHSSFETAKVCGQPQLPGA
jgi:hypothetical protein